MSIRTQEAKELFYICGRCGLEQTYLPGEEKPSPCRDCGYVHYEKDPYNIPSEIKINLNNYN